MKAFLFPGQASQYVGMMKDIYSEFGLAREYLDLADDILGLDLKQTCFEGPAEKLIRTEYTQPAIFVHSVIINDILKRANINADIAAGHSLGEYSALVSAGVFSFAEGLKAVKLRSQLMQECCDQYPGTMAAVVGMTLEQVNETINDIEGVVPANFNSPGQVAISGTLAAVDTACAKLAEAGARKTIKLDVGGAYHSPLMQHAKEKMSEYIETFKFSEFAFPVIANVNAEPVDKLPDMKNLLSLQITSPVLWYPTLEKMNTLGVTEYYEIGPGKVLQGLLKRSLKNAKFSKYGLDTVENIKGLIGE